MQQALKASGVVMTVKEREGEEVLSKIDEFGRRVVKLVSKVRVCPCRSAKR